MHPGRVGGVVTHVSEGDPRAYQGLLHPRPPSRETSHLPRSAAPTSTTQEDVTPTKVYYTRVRPSSLPSCRVPVRKTRD